MKGERLKKLAKLRLILSVIAVLLALVMAVSGVMHFIVDKPAPEEPSPTETVETTTAPTETKAEETTEPASTEGNVETPETTGATLPEGVDDGMDQVVVDASDGDTTNDDSPRKPNKNKGKDKDKDKGKGNEQNPPADDGNDAEQDPPAGDGNDAEQDPPADDENDAEQDPPAGDENDAEQKPLSASHGTITVHTASLSSESLVVVQRVQVQKKQTFPWGVLFWVSAVLLIVSIELLVLANTRLKNSLKAKLVLVPVATLLAVAMAVSAVLHFVDKPASRTAEVPEPTTSAAAETEETAVWTEAEETETVPTAAEETGPEETGPTEAQADRPGQVWKKSVPAGSGSAPDTSDSSDNTGDSDGDTGGTSNSDSGGDYDGSGGEVGSGGRDDSGSGGDYDSDSSGGEVGSDSGSGRDDSGNNSDGDSRSDSGSDGSGGDSSDGGRDYYWGSSDSVEDDCGTALGASGLTAPYGSVAVHTASMSGQTETVPAETVPPEAEEAGGLPWGLVFWICASLLAVDLIAILVISNSISQELKKQERTRNRIRRAHENAMQDERPMPDYRNPPQRQEKPSQPAAPGRSLRQTLPAPQVATIHQVGRREYQQDSLGHTAVLDDRGTLAVLADGMGGLSDGEKVSQKIVMDALTLGHQLTPGQINGALRKMVSRINDDVNQMLGPDGLYKSGSTLVAVLVSDGQFQWISVGDSRIYLYRQGYASQLNQDHDQLQVWMADVLAGTRSMDEVLRNPDGRKLTSFIGMGQLKYVDGSLTPIALEPGDRLVLMSDGIYGAVSEEALAEVLKRYPDVSQAASVIERMVREAKHPHQDNYTAIVLGF